jgi:hypothetical protein
MLISGCVFFICTEAGALGGSGNTVIRAVSFFGPGIGEAGGIGAGAGLGDFAAAEIGGGINFGG